MLVTGVITDSWAPDLLEGVLETGQAETAELLHVVQRDDVDAELAGDALDIGHVSEHVDAVDLVDRFVGAADARSDHVDVGLVAPLGDRPADALGTTHDEHCLGDLRDGPPGDHPSGDRADRDTADGEHCARDQDLLDPHKRRPPSKPR